MLLPIVPSRNVRGPRPWSLILRGLKYLAEADLMVSDIS